MCAFCQFSIVQYILLKCTTQFLFYLRWGQGVSLTRPSFRIPTSLTTYLRAAVLRLFFVCFLACLLSAINTFLSISYSPLIKDFLHMFVNLYVGLNFKKNVNYMVNNKVQPTTKCYVTQQFQINVRVLVKTSYISSGLCALIRPCLGFFSFVPMFLPSRFLTALLLALRGYRLGYRLG